MPPKPTYGTSYGRKTISVLRTSTDEDREPRTTRDSIVEWKNKEIEWKNNEIKQLQLKISKLNHQLERYIVGVRRGTHEQKENEKKDLRIKELERTVKDLRQRPWRRGYSVCNKHVKQCAWGAIQC